MSSLPATQKGVLVSKIGGPEVLEYKTDLPVPSPKEGEVLVKNNLTAINLIDTYFRKGVYDSAKPEILGKEGAGTVVALGPGANPYNFAVGDRVAWIGGGGYAEYSTPPTTRVAKIPNGVSDEKVLAVLLTGATCLSFIREAYEVKKGDWILLHAAAGGAGIIMTQLLELAGAKVIGTAGGPEKVEIVKGLGADVVIDYKSPEGANWLEKVKEVTGGEGVEDSLKAVKRKGSVVFFGNSSGVVPPFPIS
ncbi:NADPH:quinone reductase [Microsporum audouinii]